MMAGESTIPTVPPEGWSGIGALFQARCGTKLERAKTGVIGVRSVAGHRAHEQAGKRTIRPASAISLTYGGGGFVGWGLR